MSKERKDIDTTIIEAKRADRQIKELTAKLSEYKEKIQTFFDKADIVEYSVKVTKSDNYTGNVSEIRAEKTERIRVEYLPERLKEKIAPDIYNEIAIKSYSIVDMELLKGLLKKAGISASEFKKCIEIHTKIDKEALKRLYSVGDIKAADVRGCYSAKIIKGIALKEVSSD